MTTIKITTTINASIKTVFNNCRNIDLHVKSTGKTHEKAISGKIFGLIEKGETVTWKARHFGFYMLHQSIITEMEFPYYFIDEQLKGKFKRFKHIHTFKQKSNSVIMIDEIEYEVPFGLIGKLFDKLVLKNYLTNFLIERNNYIQKISVSQHK